MVDGSNPATPACVPGGPRADAAGGHGRHARLHRVPRPHWKRIWSTKPQNRSTRRPSRAPTSSACFPSPPRCSASRAPSWRKPMRSGRRQANARRYLSRRPEGLARISTQLCVGGGATRPDRVIVQTAEDPQRCVTREDATSLVEVLGQVAPGRWASSSLGRAAVGAVATYRPCRRHMSDLGSPFG